MIYILALAIRTASIVIPTVSAISDSYADGSGWAFDVTFNGGGLTTYRYVTRSSADVERKALLNEVETFWQSI